MIFDYILYSAVLQISADNNLINLLLTFWGQKNDFGQ